MTVGSLCQEADVNRMPLKESRNLLIHKGYFSLEADFDCVTGSYILEVVRKRHRKQ